MTRLASVNWNLLLANASQVATDLLMGVEVLQEIVMIQVRLQAEDLLRDFLVFSLNALQLRLTLIKVKALCAELNGVD